MADSRTGGIPQQPTGAANGGVSSPGAEPAPEWVSGSEGFGENGHRGSFGEQFIRMLATAANLDLSQRERDRVGVDWQLGFAGRAGTRRYPAIEAQVKCTSSPDIHGEHIRYQLKVKNYNWLAGRDYAMPRFLSVVLAPADPLTWSHATQDRLLLRHAAYWLCLHDLDPVENPPKSGTRTVNVPRANLLTVDDVFPGDGQGLRSSEPFARTVSRMLFAGVTCAHAAAEETLARDSLDGFGRYTEAGLSANLCEALVRIAGEEQRPFSLAFDWSPEMPMEQHSPPVSLAPLHVRVLEEGARELRERAAREEGALLHGVVTRLSGQGDRQATIYGSLLHEDPSRVRSVRVELRQEDVDGATIAWRDGLEVAVKGDVEPYGTGVRMRGVRAFVVRPE